MLDGDIAYADYWLKEEIQGFLPNTTIADGYKIYESLLNQFYDEMTPITSTKAYMVGPGNHEANYKWFQVPHLHENLANIALLKATTAEQRTKRTTSAIQCPFACLARQTLLAT